MCILKRIFFPLISLWLISALSFNAYAVTVSSECDISDIDIPLETSATVTEIGAALEISAKSAILMEPMTGQILYEQNPDEQLPPASITKIMSLLLVMEAIDDGRLKLDDTVSASEHAGSMGGSQIWLEPGETMTVDELLKASVIASANDATVALAEAIAGSEEGFVVMMNERAKQLGMNSTIFKNCTGLDAEGHLTTAHDVAIMSCQLIKHELIKNYSTVWMDTLRGGESELVNTNKLVRFYKGTTGLKTGTTSGAGYCLSATAERDGLQLAAVIMCADTGANRFEDAKKLLNYGFANYKFSEIVPEIEDNTTVDVEKGTEKSVSVKPSNNFGLLLKKTDGSSIKQETVIKESLKAPIKKGDCVGNINIYIGDEQVGSIDLVADGDVPRKTMLTVIHWLFCGLFTP